MSGNSNVKTSSTQRFDRAYPKIAMMHAERALVNDALTGTITLPVYLQTIMGQDTSTDKPTICTIPFHLENNFSFSLGNKWQPLVPTDILEDFSYLVNGLQLVGDNPGSQISFMSKQMQLAMWQGSEQPEFSVDMTFVCTERYNNPVNIIMAICESALPRDMVESKNQKTVQAKNGAADSVESVGAFAEQHFGDVGQKIKLGSQKVADGIRNTGLMAPLFYSAKFEDGQSVASDACTLTLQIGRWFRASKLIVNSISNIEFSKEVVAPPTSFDNIRLKKKRGDSRYTLNVH